MSNRHPLIRKRRPEFERGNDELTLVDLFSGTGGLTLGVAMAAHEAGLALDVRLAVDFERSAIDAYRINFPASNAVCQSVEELFSGKTKTRESAAQKRLRTEIGRVDVLVGGPPCQGHSNLNNHTRRRDPKNRLYLSMVRAAEAFRPSVVVIENVPAVLHDSDNVVQKAREQLSRAGYSIGDRVIPLVTFGVAQNRKRHVLLGILKERDPYGVSPIDFLADGISKQRDLKWAIGDLADKEPESALDEASQPNSENLRRMKYLLDHDEYDLPNKLRPKCHQGAHTYKAMYGRLKWDLPSPTITSGFGSMGRGRFMHPSKLRCLTPHEAARVQGFPDFFFLDVGASRNQLETIIGNAVPPQLTEVITRRLLRAGVLMRQP